jgi:stage V sporulation protein B
MDKRIGPEFLHNNLYRFSHTMVSHIGGAIFTVIIARILEPELFGTYSLALSFALILMTVGDLGIGEAVLRYISLNYKNKSKAKSYFYLLFRIKFTVLIVLALSLALSSKLIANFYQKPELAFPLLIASIYIIFYSLMQELSNLFYAFMNIKFYTLKEIVFQISRLIFITLIFILPISLLSSGPLVISILASLCGIIFTIIILTIKYRSFFKAEKSKIDTKELFSYVKFLSIGSLSVLFLVYTDVLILGKFVDLETIGFYKAASSLALFLASIFTVTAVVYPFFTKIDDKKRIDSITSITLKYLFMITIPLTFGAILTGRYFLRAVFGYSYLSAAPIFYVLVFLVVLLPVGELLKALLNSKGKSNQTARTILFASILNIILNFILIIYLIKISFIYAAVGAALATIFCRVIILISFIYISKKDFGLRIQHSTYIKPLIASIFMSIFLYFFTKLIYGNATLISVSVEILLGIVIYFLVLYFIKGITKLDLRYLKILLTETFKKPI